jgi:hypothetical protein
MDKKYSKDMDQINKMIEIFNSARVVKNCKEWDWQKRFPSFESAVDVLLKQLAAQRKLLLLTMIWQKQQLLNYKPKISNLKE